MVDVREEPLGIEVEEEDKDEEDEGEKADAAGFRDSAAEEAKSVTGWRRCRAWRSRVLPKGGKGEEGKASAS